MAKQDNREARTQIGINVPPDVMMWLEKLRLKEGLSYTQAAMAGFVALRFLKKEDRDGPYSWSRMLDDKSASWEDVESAGDQAAEKRGEALARKLEAALHAKAYSEPKRPPVRRGREKA